ncbi:MAG: hypothetical protein LBG57_03875 [Treponema sp.]|jgi:hypothetical protein|nr:hypothetical protein [Treponema sp.]
MTMYINFEDNLFILNVRIRMIRDLLRLDPDPGLFLERTVDDMEFIDKALEFLTGNLKENTRLFDRDREFDNLSNIEWQFSQLLLEFAKDSSPLSPAKFPQIRDRIFRLKDSGAARRKTIDEAVVPAEQTRTEPMVSSAELNELFREF